jgi:hypothetical protein
MAKECYNMLEPFEAGGYWWLPDNLQDKTFGTLVYSPSEGVRLKLMGEFFNHMKSSRFDTVPLIHGYGLNGERITLLDSLYASGSIRMPGYATVEYVPKSTFLGWHFDSLDNASFDEAVLHFSGSEECVGVSCLNDKWEFDDKGKVVGYTLRYSKPSEICFPIGSYQVKVNWSFATSGDGTRITTVEQNVRLRITSQQQIPYMDFLRGPVSIIRSLLELSADCVLPFRTVWFFSPAHLDTYGDGETYKAAIKLIWAQRLQTSGCPTKRSREMMFTLVSLDARLAEVVAKWEAFQRRHESTTQTFSTLLRIRNEIPWEHHFLSLVYALESYHRREYPVSGWVKLCERVAQLWSAVPEQLRILLGDKEEFASSVADTRNFYAHQDDALKGRALSGRNLYLGIVRLEILIRGIILRSLGFEDAEIIEMVRRLGYQEQVWNLLRQ